MKKYDIDFDIKEEDKIIKMIDDKGIEKEYIIVAHVRTYNGDFFAYTDNKEYKDGEVPIYVNSIIKENGKVILDSVDNDDIPKIVSKIKERLNYGC